MGEVVDSLLLRAGALADRFFDEPPRALPAAAVDRALQPGVEIAGRYTIEKLLGEGGFGRVWRARDAQAATSIALKELLSADGAHGGQELEQEFFTLSKLQHPNIVRVHDYGELQHGSRYLVMELVPGEDVLEKLKSGPLPREVAYRVLLGLLQGLHLLHSRLYVHCDVKAENVRVTDKGETKLMDFGLLHQLGTPAVQVQGTLAYMAPEMMTGGVIDARTDLYSVGVLAYEMLTGSLPFAGDTHAELMQKHMREVPKPPSWFLDIPKPVDDFVLQLMEKDPAKRFKDAAHALEVVAELSGQKLEAAPVSSRTSYLYSAALVGRDREAAQLESVRAGLIDKRGAALFIGGRGGEGKTRLLEEFRLRVKLDRTPWAAGQCRKEGLAPLAPMAEALQQLLPRVDDETMKQLGPVLAHVVPSLKEKGFVPPPFANPVQARARIHDAVAGVLAALAQQGPFVICIEDVHWADGGTMEMFNHLVRARGELPYALVGTFRTNEVERTSIVYATIDEGGATLLDLPPLQAGDVEELLASTLHDHALPAGFVGRLYETTKGNAFFVVELLRLLVEAGDLAQDKGAWVAKNDSVELPDALPRVVEKRLAFLDAELLDLCRAAAPAGRALDPKLLLELAALAPAQLYERLEALVERQLVQRQGGRFFFAHETIRDGIYAALPDDRRKALHHSIGALLEKGRGSGPRAPAIQLAYHYKRGAEPERAIDFFMTAAKESLGKQQLLEATQALREGVELVEPSPRKDKEQLLVAFYDALAQASVATHPPTCLMAAGRLVELWSKQLDPEAVLQRRRRRRARAANAPALLKRFYAQPPKGPPPPFDPATKDPERIVDRMLQIQGMQAMAFAVLGEPEKAIGVAEIVKQRTDDPRSPLLAMTAVPRILALFHMGRFQEQAAVCDEAIGRFDAAGKALPPPLRVFHFLATYLKAMGEALGGLPLGPAAERATALAEQFDLPQERGFAILPRLVRASLCGEPDEVQRHHAAMEDVCRRLGFPHVLNSRLRLWLPVYYLERGDFDLARATTAKLAGMAKATRDTWLATYAGIYRGLDLLESNDAAAAAAQLEEAVKTAREKQLGRLTTALCARGQALVDAGRLDEARAILAEAHERATSAAFGCAYDVATAKRLLGLAQGGASGRALVQQAIDAAVAAENTVQTALGFVALARIDGAGDGRDGPGVGAAALDRAAELFTRLQNRLWIERVRRLREAAA